MALQPYPGLRPFEPDETDIFFGRESHVDAMVNRLAQHRLLAVTGTSGSGKSSLVKAGLIEALEIGLLAEAGAVWHAARLRPRDHPMAELAAALISALGGDRYEHDIALRRAALERGPLALVEELVERPLPGGANLFILVDQFEELFRYRGLAGREEAEAFVALLLASAGQRTVPIYIVLTMRSDYFGECAQFQGLAEAVSDAQYLCPRLTREQITAAIESPAAVFGGKVEPLLVSRMLNDMGTDPDQLPLMQHALMRLWDEAKARDTTAPVLRLEDYLAVDGLKGSLSRHADEILAEITRDAPQRAETARRLFCLVTEGEGERAVRRLARVGEVMDVSGEPLAEVALVADAFRAPGRSLLMPPLERPLDLDTVLDISHESLIRQWQTLKDWVRTEAASAEQYRDTGRRARRWAAGEAGFWEGMDLDIGLAWREREHPNNAWAERYGGNFPLAMRFLDESQAHREAIEAERHTAERRERRRQRGFLGASLAGLFMVSVLFGVAAYEWSDAAHQKQAALLAQQDANDQKLIAEHNVNLTDNFVSTVAHIIKAPNRTPSPADAKSLLKLAQELQGQLNGRGLSDAQLHDRATILISAATILSRLGDEKNEALTAATLARDTMEPLVRSNPDQLEWASELSESSAEIGEAQRLLGHFDEAIEAYSYSLAIQQELVQNHPDNGSWQIALRLIHEKIGDLYRSQNQFDKAVEAYRKSSAIVEALVPQNPNYWKNMLALIHRRIGDTLSDQGRLDDALVSYNKALATAKDLGWQQRLQVYTGIASTFKLKGLFDEAVAFYRDGLANLQDVARNQPDNTQLKNSLINTEMLIGDTLRDDGHLDEALGAYREERDAVNDMTRDHPSDDNIRLGVALADERIGDALKTEGQLEEALAVYSESLNIREELAEKYPENSQWQFFKAASKGRVSSILAAQGDLDGSLLGYNIRLEIYNKLANKQPTYAQWKQYKAESYDDIGDVLKAQDKLDEALLAYNDSSNIQKKLKEDYPGNLEYRSDLSRSYAAIGFVLAAQGHLDGALAAHQNSLEIRVELVNKGPPSNAKQRDLAVSHRRIGDMHMAQDHFDEAFAEYTESLKIDEALTKKDPINAEWQDDLAESNEGIGEALKAQGRNKEALDAYKRGSDIRRMLAQKAPSNVVWQTDLAVNLYKVAFLSGDAKGNLAEAQEILRRLDAAGKLRPRARAWIAKVETALAEIKT